VLHPSRQSVLIENDGIGAAPAAGRLWQLLAADAPAIAPKTSPRRAEVPAAAAEWPAVKARAPHPPATVVTTDGCTSFEPPDVGNA